MEKQKRFSGIDEAVLLEAMLAAPDELIVVVNKNGYIERMSKAYGEFSGIDARNAIGRHVSEVIENTRMDIVVKTGLVETGETQDIHGERMIATRIPIHKNGVVVGAYGRVLVRNSRELHALHDKLSSIEMELNMYKRTFEKINTAKYTVDDIIGESGIMRDLKDSVRKVAKTNSNVLIMGESGTGKELFAHSIHAGSMRKKAPFVCVNCGSIPEQLIESELFGYEEGAFTGARKGGKMGLFAAAHGGTIFLDEIGELPLAMQVRLLRVLQDREIQRVGANVREAVNVRVVAATNRNLYQMVQAGEFRSDFVLSSECRDAAFAAAAGTQGRSAAAHQHDSWENLEKGAVGAVEISRDAMNFLLNYDWPGNVRELENVLERAINFTEAGEKIEAKDLPERITERTVSQAVLPLKEIMESAERDAIENALLRCRNCKAKAAGELGISRTTLYEKMEKYDILA